MPQISSVAVFCGSRPGNNPAFAEAARQTGEGLARAGIRLVYGAGRNGLMGIVADAALAAGGQVLGVIPDFLMKWEVAHDGLTERLITSSMHDRKRLMAEASDAFVALPGGVGTMDEIVEIISWRQLRQHDKPIFVCDVAGSAAPFVAAIDGAIDQGFAGPETRALFSVVKGVPALLEALAHASRGTHLEAGRV